MTCIFSIGKESWSTQRGKMSVAPLEEKDRNYVRISCVVMWWRIVVGVEIQADGCLPRIHRPYKTKGFTPRVLYFTSLPLHLQAPLPIV